MPERSPFPPLHPTLVALSIVLAENEDLGMINRLHPKRRSHYFYVPEAIFPTNISHLLPPTADRWWVRLGKP
jgi:hypothetical protein